ncbi:hypothetical protein AJ87_48330 [Rhizobium yanglingense]|nr:hypothetical protein AJ87_48330 [Rhizobium yanglingense]
MEARVRLLNTPLIFTQIMRHEGDAKEQRAQKRGRKADKAKRNLSTIKRPIRIGMVTEALI